MGVLFQIVSNWDFTAGRPACFTNFQHRQQNGATRRDIRQVMPIDLVLNLLSLMDHSQIILPGCFSNLSICQFSIPDEPLYHLPQLKFDGEYGTSIIENISDFLKFFEPYEINDEYFACVLFSLTLEAHSNRWFHTLPSTSIIFIISSKIFFKPSIGMITGMFLK